MRELQKKRKKRMPKNILLVTPTVMNGQKKRWLWEANWKRKKIRERIGPFQWGKCAPHHFLLAHLDSARSHSGSLHHAQPGRRMHASQSASEEQSPPSSFAAAAASLEGATAKSKKANTGQNAMPAHVLFSSSMLARRENCFSPRPNSG